MTHSIGRVLYEGRDALNPALKRRYVSDVFRAYRFPYELVRSSVIMYVPNEAGGMLTDRLPYARKHLLRYKMLDELTKKLPTFGVRKVEVRGRSRFLRITLMAEGLRFKDHGNSWKQIEEAMREATGLPIADHSPRRFVW